MKKWITLFLLFVVCNAIGQSKWHSSYTLNTALYIGESHTYHVSDFFKVDEFFIGFRSEVKSVVNFTVVDTAQNGYWIRYKVLEAYSKNSSDYQSEITAKLLEEINLLAFVSDSATFLDSISYYKNKKAVEFKLGESFSSSELGKKDQEFVTALRKKLKEDAGLETLLGPLIMFEMYYTSGTYKLFRISAPGVTTDILNNIHFDGTIDKKWEKTSKDSILRLNYLFTGHPAKAARYYKSIYEPLLAAKNIKRGKLFYPPEMIYKSEYDFSVKAGVSFPISIFRKTVGEYIIRSVNKVEMREISD